MSRYKHDLLESKQDKIMINICIELERIGDLLEAKM